MYKGVFYAQNIVGKCFYIIQIGQLTPEILHYKVTHADRKQLHEVIRCGRISDVTDPDFQLFIVSTMRFDLTTV